MFTSTEFCTHLRLSSLLYAEMSIPVNAGIMVSGCYSSTGDAYLWGANTNSQLGKGNAIHVICPSAYICTSRLADEHKITHLAELELKQMRSLADYLLHCRR